MNRGMDAAIFWIALMLVKHGAPLAVDPRVKPEDDEVGVKHDRS
ncbi:hypothetical protein C7477_10497 [Phyllobacterium leguminum]|uniref:Uncharacterized protein n=1 Tax=Phyllobacterium leguminum TaxID=314237 RepID=A0A318T3I9_9HYPH|nr:hypothetical protein C7477_10497 [Phyllobacterium leguminum]